MIEGIMKLRLLVSVPSITILIVRVVVEKSSCTCKSRHGEIQQGIFHPRTLTGGAVNPDQIKSSP